jgi:UDP-glucose 4-epimerase
MNILVTGGFGFIGSYLVEVLLRDRDTTVHVVDNLLSSPLPLDRLLEEIGDQPRLSYSICFVAEFCNSPHAGVQFDEIYHLASVVGPAGILPHTGKMIKEIVDDTYDLINLALKCGARLLDVSTSEVYGGGQEGLCSETIPKIIPPNYSARLEYAVGKLATEIALINTAKVSPLQVVIVRPFNVSGPRQSGVGGFVCSAPLKVNRAYAAWGS